MPALCISSRSSDPKEGVCFVLSASRASCMAVRVISGIFPLVLIHTSVVKECVANSSFASRHQPLCLLHFPSALATSCASLKRSWALLLVPSGWMGRIQLSVAKRVAVRSNFSLSSRPYQLMTVGCRVAISSPQILSLTLIAFLKKGGMVRVSPWYLVAW